LIVVNNDCENSNNLFTKRAISLYKKRFYKFEIIFNETNLGLSKALNQAFKIIDKKAEYIWRLDNDILLNKKSLLYLLNELESHPKIGCAGSKANEYDNKSTTLCTGWKYHLSLAIGFQISSKKATKCDCLSGYSILYRKLAVNKIGYLSDENFFAYLEDFDFCFEIKKYSYKVVYVPQSIVYHRLVRSKQFNPFVTYLLVRNKIILVRKNTKFYQKIIFYPFLLIISGPLFFIRLILHDGFSANSFEVIKSYFKAISDGYNMKFKPSIS